MPALRFRAWRGALFFTAIAFVGGCGSSNGGEPAPRSPAAGDHARETDGGRGPAADLVRRCNWSTGGKASEAEVRSTFVDREPGKVRVLLAADSVRSGQVLSVAIANDTSRTLMHGTFSHIEDHRGRPVEIKGPYGFKAVGLIVKPKSVGPCMTLPVPSATEPGNYVAVVESVGDSAGRGGRDLRAGFAVAGEPVSEPGWERRLRKAAQENRKGCRMRPELCSRPQ